MGKAAMLPLPSPVHLPDLDAGVDTTGRMPGLTHTKRETGHSTNDFNWDTNIPVGLSNTYGAVAGDAMESVVD